MGMDKDQLVEFHRRYADEMKIRFIEKRHWGIVTKVLRYLLKKYLAKYASKVPKLAEKLRPHVLKKIVVLTYNIGDRNIHWKAQVRTAGHEGEHTEQIDDYIKKGGKVSGWYRDYFFDPEFRAMQEGGANATEGEIDFAIDGTPPEVPNLDSYYVTTQGQRLSDKAYTKRINRVKELGRGSATSKASAKAIAILKDMKVIA